MKIIWLGHGSFRIEIGDRVLLIDPWLNGNPLFPAEKRKEAWKRAEAKNKESKNPKTLTKKTLLKSFGKINLRKGPASFSEKALKIVGAFKADWKIIMPAEIPPNETKKLFIRYF